MSNTSPAPAATKTVPAEGVAIGRSGQISRRTEFAGKAYGVDVKLPLGATKNYKAGVVTRAFAKESDAIAFAEKVNKGAAGKWYADRGATGAIVVPVWPVPAADQPWPWETPKGKAALRKAHGVAPRRSTKKAEAAAAPAS